MAAVSIVKPLAVAGLHIAPTISDLRESSNAYVNFFVLYDKLVLTGPGIGITNFLTTETSLRSTTSSSESRQHLHALQRAEQVRTASYSWTSQGPTRHDYARNNLRTTIRVLDQTDEYSGYQSRRYSWQ